MNSALFLMLVSTAFFIRWGLSQDRHTNSVQSLAQGQDCDLLSRNEYEQEPARISRRDTAVNGEPQHKQFA